MAAAASGGACPSLTSAKAKISTHPTPKNSVVERSSKLLISIARSFRSTRKAVLKNTSYLPYDAAVTRAEAGCRRFVREQPALAHQCHSRDKAVCQVEIVRG